LSKRYGATVALASLDLEIERGEVFGLLGPNGSGKTTFIRLLGGYLLPTAGHLEICGCDAVEQSLEARRRIGYVPEAAPLYGYMRVREFLVFMARLRGLDAQGREEACRCAGGVLRRAWISTDRVPSARGGTRDSEGRSGVLP